MSPFVWKLLFFIESKEEIISFLASAIYYVDVVFIVLVLSVY